MLGTLILLGFIVGGLAGIITSLSGLFSKDLHVALAGTSLLAFSGLCLGYMIMEYVSMIKRKLDAK